MWELERINKLVDTVAAKDEIIKEKNEMINHLMKERDESFHKYFLLEIFCGNFINLSWWERLFRGNKLIKEKINELNNKKSSI